jgi:SNF2 family DNA or RNA helicase
MLPTRAAERYHPPWAPRIKQAEALTKCGHRAAFAYRMKPRVGKTKCTLDDFGQLELDGDCQDLAVIAPAGALTPWIEAIDEHLSADLRSRVTVHYWRSGGGVTYKKELRAFLDVSDGPRILLMNIEALSTVKTAREVMEEFLEDRRSMLAVDEATCIKTPGAKRTKFVLQRLRMLADYRRILSGLLTPKSPLDLFAPYFFLDWRILGFRNYFSFRNHYAVLADEWYGGRKVKIVVGFKNLEELQRKIAPHSFYCDLSDCYDAPEKIYMMRHVEMTQEQRRLYNELVSFATAQLNATSHVTATLVITQILRLHQILCGHVVDENGNYHEIAENRTESLIDLLRESEEKVIIWASYDADIHRITDALREEFGVSSVAQFWGGNVNVRESEEHRFKTDPYCRFMVATAQAGGRGREWSIANLVVYYSNTHNLEFRAQSEDRPQAVDKLEHVTYVDLVVPGTVDEKIIYALRNKINLASLVDGEAYRAWLV